VASWIFRRDHPSRPKAMICCFFSSFKTFAMLREATNPPAAVNVLDVSSESMAAFQVFTYGRFWVFTEEQHHERRLQQERHEAETGKAQREAKARESAEAERRVLQDAEKSRQEAAADQVPKEATKSDSRGDTAIQRCQCWRWSPLRDGLA
jgi:hypothetical protein